MSHVATIPGLAIMVVVVGFNLLVRDGYGVDLHVSKGFYSPKDRQAFGLRGCKHGPVEGPRKHVILATASFLHMPLVNKSFERLPASAGGVSLTSCHSWGYVIRQTSNRSLAPALLIFDQRPPGSFPVWPLGAC